MNCPKCEKPMKGISPLSKEEFICLNTLCTEYGKEHYLGEDEVLGQ